MRRRYGRFVPVLLVVAALCSWAVAQTSYSFAELAWGSSLRAVTSQLEARGYSFNRVTETGSHRFNGRLLNRDALISALFNDRDELVKLSVYLFHDNESRSRRFFEAERTWKEMKDILTRRYGPPDDDFSFFMSPYYRGDGYETQAVELEKATFAAFWPTGADGSLLATMIDKDVDVAVIYEGPGWEAEYERRRSRGSSDF
jgi:hypothetical protein